MGSWGFSLSRPLAFGKSRAGRTSAPRDRATLQTWAEPVEGRRESRGMRSILGARAMASTALSLPPCSPPSWLGPGRRVPEAAAAAAVTSYLCCCSCWAENSPLSGRLAQGVKSWLPESSMNQPGKNINHSPALAEEWKNIGGGGWGTRPHKSQRFSRL